jgi:hypothetical protein
MVGEPEEAGLDEEQRSPPTNDVRLPEDHMSLKNLLVAVHSAKYPMLWRH